MILRRTLSVCGVFLALGVAGCGTSGGGGTGGNAVVTHITVQRDGGGVQELLVKLAAKPVY